MKQIHSRLLRSALLILSLFCIVCLQATTVTLTSGTLTYTPTTLDADQSATLSFTPNSSCTLYSYTGDVYVHIGTIDATGTWGNVPASWSTNLDKCKAVRTGTAAPYTYTLTLSPTIRQWFATTSSVTKIGMVFRSSDGTKQTTPDIYVAVNDNSASTNYGTPINKVRPDGVKAGINIINDNTVTFVLDDQDNTGAHSNCAYVLGDFNSWTQSDADMMYWDDTNKCWWLTVTGLDSAKEYAFQYHMYTTAGSLDIADPYSTKVSDSNDQYIPSTTYPDLMSYPSKANGICSVFKTKSTAYDWQVPDFTIKDANDLRIYELLLRDFTGTSTVNGTLAGALAKLDYLKSLGINAIELMPVQEFGGNDSWGYNPDFYFALDKAYGTDTDYKQFIDACHQKGIAVLFDVVYNQATGDFPYCKLYWDADNSRPSSKSLWFNVTAPHPYSVFNDFNHSSTCVQNYIIRNLQYLLSEYKVDGFRFDLAKGFTQTSSTTSTVGNYDASRIAILEKYADAVHAANANAVVILELFAVTSEEQVYANDNIKMWRNVNNAYCQSAMGYSSSSDFSSLYTASTGMPYGSLVSYMESHDEERAAYKQEAYGVTSIMGVLSEEMKQLSANACFFLTVPGPKMIWEFGEMGYDISKGSDTSKRLCHWEYLDDSDRVGLYNTYAKLNALRTENPELFSSAATFSWNVADTNWSTGRFINITSSDGNKHLVVAGNFDASSQNLTVTFPHTGTWYSSLDNNSELTVTSTSQAVTMPMHTAKVYIDFKSAATGIENNTDDRSVSVYPNPVMDVVNVSGDATTLTLYTLNGVQVTSATKANTLSLAGLPSGTYLLHIAGVARTVKILKR
jgi:1,4-alpha-glucan branching enzyme